MSFGLGRSTIGGDLARKKAALDIRVGEIGPGPDPDMGELMLIGIGMYHKTRDMIS